MSRYHAALRKPPCMLGTLSHSWLHLVPFLCVLIGVLQHNAAPISPRFAPFSAQALSLNRLASSKVTQSTSLQLFLTHSCSSCCFYVFLNVSFPLSPPHTPSLSSLSLSLSSLLFLSFFLSCLVTPTYLSLAPPSYLPRTSFRATLDTLTSRSGPTSTS